MYRQVVLTIALMISASATVNADHPDVMVYAPEGDRTDVAHRASVDGVVDIFNRKRRAGLKVHTPQNLRLSHVHGNQFPVMEAFVRRAGRLFYYRGELRTDSQGHVVLPGGPGDPVPLKQLIECGSRAGQQQPIVVLDANTSDAAKVLAGCQQITSSTPLSLELLIHVRESSAPVNPNDNFSSNLALGIAGQADKNGDETITTSELFQYTSQRSPAGSVHRMRSVNARNAGPREVWRLHPRTMDQLAADLAAETAQHLHNQRISAVALPDFIADEHGTLSPLCLKTFKKELLARSGYQYRVLATDWLRPKLVEELVTPHNIQSPKMAQVFKRIRKQCPNGKTGILLGTLTRSKSLLQMAVTPWGEDGTPAQDIAGSAMLAPAEWAHAGKSAVDAGAMAEHFPTPSLTSAPPSGTRSAVQSRLQHRPDFARTEDELATKEVIESFEASTQRHPMADPKFPFRVNLCVDGKPMPSSWSPEKRRLYTPLSQGKDYAIRVTNKSDKPVFMRLLVDGLNTLPDRPLTIRQDAYEVSAVDEAAARAPAQHVNLRSARAWWVEKGTYQVDGFFTGFEPKQSSLKAEGQYRTFRVTDATTSLAWNKGYKKDVGIVTAVFFAPTQPVVAQAPDATRGTDYGLSRSRAVTYYRGAQIPGEMLAVIQIHYGIDPPAKETTLVTVVD